MRKTCSICGEKLAASCDDTLLVCQTCATKAPEASVKLTDSSSPTDKLASGSDVSPIDSTGDPHIGGQETVIRQVVGSEGVDKPTCDEPVGPAQTISYGTSGHFGASGAAANDGEAAQHVGRWIGRFKIGAILGRGSFGMVFRAFDPLLDREVAIKVPRLSDDDAERSERFLREAKAAARLRHPNIVAVYESGRVGDISYIAASSLTAHHCQKCSK